MKRLSPRQLCITILLLQLILFHSSSLLPFLVSAAEIDHAKLIHNKGRASVFSLQSVGSSIWGDAEAACTGSTYNSASGFLTDASTHLKHTTMLALAQNKYPSSGNLVIAMKGSKRISDGAFVWSDGTVFATSTFLCASASVYCRVSSASSVNSALTGVCAMFNGLSGSWGGGAEDSRWIPCPASSAFAYDAGGGSMWALCEYASPGDVSFGSLSGESTVRSQKTLTQLLALPTTLSYQPKSITYDPWQNHYYMTGSKFSGSELGCVILMYTHGDVLPIPIIGAISSNAKNFFCACTAPGGTYTAIDFLQSLPPFESYGESISVQSHVSPSTISFGVRGQARKLTSIATSFSFQEDITLGDSCAATTPPSAPAADYNLLGVDGSGIHAKWLGRVLHVHYDPTEASTYFSCLGQVLRTVDAAPTVVERYAGLDDPYGGTMDEAISAFRTSFAYWSGGKMEFMDNYIFVALPGDENVLMLDRGSGTTHVMCYGSNPAGLPPLFSPYISSPALISIVAHPRRHIIFALRGGATCTTTGGKITAYDIRLRISRDVFTSGLGRLRDGVIVGRNIVVTDCGNSKLWIFGVDTTLSASATVTATTTVMHLAPTPNTRTNTSSPTRSVSPSRSKTQTASRSFATRTYSASATASMTPLATRSPTRTQSSTVSTLNTNTLSPTQTSSKSPTASRIFSKTATATPRLPRTRSHTFQTASRSSSGTHQRGASKTPTSSRTLPGTPTSTHLPTATVSLLATHTHKTRTPSRQAPKTQSASTSPTRHSKSATKSRVPTDSRSPSGTRATRSSPLTLSLHSSTLSSSVEASLSLTVVTTRSAFITDSATSKATVSASKSGPAQTVSSWDDSASHSATVSMPVPGVLATVTFLTHDDEAQSKVIRNSTTILKLRDGEIAIIRLLSSPKNAFLCSSTKCAASSSSSVVRASIQSCVSHELRVQLKTVSNTSTPEPLLNLTLTSCFLHQPTNAKERNMSFVFTVEDDRPVQVPVIPLEVLRGAQDATVAASFSAGMTGNPVVATQASRMSMIVSLVGCDGELDDLGFSDHPFGFGVGGDEADEEDIAPRAGLVLGNILFTGGIAALQLVAAEVWYHMHKAKKKTRMKALGDVRFPGLLAVPMLLWFQPIITSSVVLLLRRSSDAGFVAVACVGLIFTAGGLVLLICLYVKFSARFVTFDPPVLLRDKVANFVLGSGKWESTKTIKERGIPFVRLFGGFFKDFNFDTYAFTVIDLFVAVGLAVIDAQRSTDPFWCQIAGLATLLIFLLYCAALLYLRPYNVQLSLWVFIPANIIQTLGVAFLVLYLFDETQLWALSWGSVLPVVATFAILAKSLFDVLVMLVEGTLRVVAYLTRSPFSRESLLGSWIAYRKKFKSRTDDDEYNNVEEPMLTEEALLSSVAPNVALHEEKQQLPSSSKASTSTDDPFAGDFIRAPLAPEVMPTDANLIVEEFCGVDNPASAVLVKSDIQPPPRSKVLLDTVSPPHANPLAAVPAVTALPPTQDSSPAKPLPRPKKSYGSVRRRPTQASAALLPPASASDATTTATPLAPTGVVAKANSFKFVEDDTSSEENFFDWL